MDKPYYVIDFNAFNCMIDIRVNDVPVFCMNIEGQVSTIIPVNNAILESGKQQTTYNVLPLLGETTLRDDASFSAAVWLYDASGEEIEKVKEINNFTMPENKTEIPLPIFKGKDLFWAEVPYKLHAWQNSQDLTEVKDLRLYVDLAYSEIEEMIRNEQYDQFASLIKKREDNIATCMYLSEKEKNERVSELIDMIKTGFKVVPTSSKDIMLVFGNDKLVSLRQPNMEDSALLLVNPETEDELSLEIQFHLEQGKTELMVI